MTARSTLRRLRRRLTAAATAIVLFGLAAASLLAVGCAQVSRVATGVAVDQGMIDQQQSDSINRSVVAVEKTFEDLTPEQEHYIGRAVAASLLASHRPLDAPEANRYLNELGQSLALASERPETYGGYHFLLLDSDEINAFACPGGLILVTRGLVRCCATEDALAAVLAHEIAHVQARHGLKAIKRSRLTGALTILAAEGARNFGSEDLARLVTALEGSVNDIVQTLVVSGYSRTQESEADAAAIAILAGIGYDPRGLEAMLTDMKANWQPSAPGFARTHPSPADRLADVAPAMAGQPPLQVPEVRKVRFRAALHGVL
ncbi:MAG: M48 family metalloprotease [Candidatus Krumholzibacteriia bacterium]